MTHSLGALRAETVQPQPAQPQQLAGYGHVHRYWDRSFECHAAKILPGEYYVTSDGEMITTVLGSCVSACIRDTLVGIGGMNHFMLPGVDGNWRAEQTDYSARYGSFAMEKLINEILKHGGSRRNLEVKLFGGGQVLANMTDVGARNIKFVREYVRTECLPISSEDLGDIHPRRVVFFPGSGKVMVKKLLRLNNKTISERETNYMKTLAVATRAPVEDDVELF